MNLDIDNTISFENWEVEVGESVLYGAERLLKEKCIEYFLEENAERQLIRNKIWRCEGFSEWLRLSFRKLKPKLKWRLWIPRLPQN